MYTRYGGVFGKWAEESVSRLCAVGTALRFHYGTAAEGGFGAGAAGMYGCVCVCVCVMYIYIYIICIY